ncbi:MAG TPA: protein kinase [Blastocatellia bacterium]|nr:protein kinase [Blastocatellia bacterium]
MTLEIGTVINHYRVLSSLGAGGMGEVYLAEDTRLGRKVALKLLPASFVKNADRLRRFEQEARAASALNHPNIITIHDIGQSDSTHFIATEYIEGETLRARLGAGPRLQLLEILDIGIQVAGALAAAHQAGIVHRDIKPENVMLRPDGYVKVLDFGIAKLTDKFIEQESTNADSLDMEAPTLAVVETESNVILGSPSYMSPEQARGQKLDARTDIFSLGVVIYEMIAGRKPFLGDTVVDIVASILNQQPEPLSVHSPEVPDRIDRVVARAMSKDKGDRYQTAREFMIALKKQKQRLEFDAGLELSVSPDIGGGTTVAIRDVMPTLREGTTGSLTTRRISITEQVTGTFKKPGAVALIGAAAVALVILFFLFIYPDLGATRAMDSIAVLPFVNDSQDQNMDYLSDGITESLINNLSQSPNLKVMSRNSVFRYKGRYADARDVGHDLNVQAVLSGRIVQRGDNLSISVELVDAGDNSQVWGKQYNLNMAELLSVQEEIARLVTEKLRLRMTGEQKKRLTKTHTDSTEAYQLYLRGRYHWNKRTEEGLKRGIEYFDQAIEKDPTFALAYAGLADCYALLTEYSTIPPAESRQKAKAAAMRALEIDDTLAEAHTSLAAVHEYDWNWAEAEREYRRAIEMNPNYATAHHWYAIFLGGRARFDEGLREIRRAQELDPLSLIINTGLGRLLYNARRNDEAIAQLKKTLEMDPAFPEAHFQLALAYEAKRMYGEALREFELSRELYKDPTMIGWSGRVYALMGNRDQALKVAEELKQTSKERYVSPYMLAIIYTALGDKEQAYEWLDRVYAERSYYVTWLKVDPVFDGLRADPRFIDFLRKVGLA